MKYKMAAKILPALFNVLILVGIVAIFNVGKTAFEQVVLSLLVLVVVNGNMGTALYMRKTEQAALELHQQLLAGRGNVNEYEKRYVTRLEERLHDGKLVFRMNTWCNVVYILVALVNLVRNLW